MNLSMSWHNNAINSDMQKRRFALLLPAGYGERWMSEESVCTMLNSKFHPFVPAEPDFFHYKQEDINVRANFAVQP